jgi:hypothetical protein
MHKQTHTPQTGVEFVNACKTLDNDGIYMLFEEKISEKLRDELYSFSRPYANNVEQNLAGTHTFEPCRDAMITLGMKYNVQSLIDY